MVLGADVTHGETFSLRPSVAAVVSSIDKGYTKYAAQSLTQGAREEKITQMGNMVSLEEYYTTQLTSDRYQGALTNSREPIIRIVQAPLSCSEMASLKVNMRKS